MRKRLCMWLLTAALAVLLAGCAGTTPQSEASESAPPQGGSSESESPLVAEGLLDDEAFLNPDKRFWMLKMSHTMVKMYPEDACTDYFAMLEKYGYAGVVTNVSWSNYLVSDKMWGFFEEQMAWAAEAGERVWLYDEEGYPSGAARTLVLEGNPEYEATGLARSQTVVSGGESAVFAAPPASHTPLFAVAYPGTGDDNKDLAGAVDLTGYIAGDGSLSWTAPAGDWVVELFMTKPLYEDTHASGNVHSDRRYVNIMNRDAIAKFIDLTYEAYYAHAGDYFGTMIEAFFTDEPSLMSFYVSDYEGTPVTDFTDPDFVRYPNVAWLDGFFEEFESRMGYDLAPYITYLFGGDSEEAARVRYDYWTVAAALIEEAYYQQIGDWCEAHGVAFSGHMLAEEALNMQVICEGNYFRNWEHMGIPGIDMLTSSPEKTFEQALTPKLAASVSRLYDRGGVMSECSTFSDQSPTGLTVSIEQIRCGLAAQYALGVTQVNSYYGYNEVAPENAEDDEKGITGLMCARMGYTLSEGQHVSDVLLYYPVETAFAELLPTENNWNEPRSEKLGKVCDEFQGAMYRLLEAQLDMDILDSEALLQSAVVDGLVVSPGGEAFRVIVMPPVSMLSTAVIDKLTEFADAGIGIVFIGDNGELRTPTGEDSESAREKWESLRSRENCVVTEYASSAAALAAEMIGTCDLVLGERSAILYNHMRREDGDVYLLVNYGDSPIDTTATFRAEGSVRLLDPLTGEIAAVESVANGDGTTTVEISFDAYDYIIVEISR